MTATATSYHSFKDTRIGLLPTNWHVAKLGELIEEVREKNGHDHRHPVFTISNIHGFILSDEFFDKQVYSKELNTYKVVRKSCFAYNPYRANVGSVGLFSQDVGLVSPAYVVFRASYPERLCPDFLYRLIKSPRYLDEIRRIALSRGSVRRSLSFGDLADFLVPLPPLPEQKKIAYVLSALQTAIEKTEAVIKATNEVKKSLMKYLFTYGPVPVSEAASVRLKQTEIGSLPEDWAVVRLGEVCDISTGTTPSTDRQDYYTGTIPFIKTNQIAQNVIRHAETYISDQAVSDYNLKVHRRGTVFMAMYGQGKTRGQVGLLDMEGTTSQNTAAIVPRAAVDSSFLWVYLTSRYDALRSTGFHGQISHLNLGYVRQLPVALPAIAVQRRISDSLMSCVSKIVSEEGKRKALEELFRSLSSTLMSGQIRVNNLGVGT